MTDPIESPRPYEGDTGEKRTYQGRVMCPNTHVSEGSHHRLNHWYVEECDVLDCGPRDTDGPDGDSPVAADAVVVVQSLMSPASDRSDDR